MSQKKAKPGHIKFAVLAVDIVCFSVAGGMLNILLGKVHSPPYFVNRWAAIGGLIFPAETAEQTADRLLRTKAGFGDIYIEQLATFSRIDRDPHGRVVSVAYMSLVQENEQKKEKAQIETKWCPVYSLPPLAYDHDEIVQIAIERLQSKIKYTTIARHLLPEEFTLSELQKMYEVVLNEKLDKRNFRKKIMASGVLKDTKRTKRQGIMRPATLYTFARKGVQTANIL